MGPAQEWITLNRIVALVFLTLLVIFGVQNTQEVTFHFLTLDVGPAPILIAVFGAAIIGVVVGWLLSVPGHMRDVSSRRHLEEELAAANLRTSTAVTDMQDSRARALPPKMEQITDSISDSNRSGRP